ncbi:hypothetical protein N7532_011172 [Penicillium argentinense]|uniref:Uncharacterized protein n=1 Tax=Penicillium argentinense TaxID=1131581 RepID=A0A9W9EHX9_9EURO|nr:uncharacterized protein N7532_011172 [Penicillium argentinense]KAJ5082129.1 hypothetical protein N7532_011172 [Penicillium argentinense]
MAVPDRNIISGKLQQGFGAIQMGPISGIMGSGARKLQGFCCPISAALLLMKNDYQSVLVITDENEDEGRNDHNEG